METVRKFSDVTESYVKHVGNLNEARMIFENETKQFGNVLFRHLEEVTSRDFTKESGLSKLRWSRAGDWSSAREVAWINFVASVRIELDIRTPDRTNFKNGCLYLYFEICFDGDLGRFVFQARLENQNQVTGSEQIDEIVHNLVSKKSELFPKTQHIKSNTTILFKREVSSELYDDYSQYIDDSAHVVEEAVDQVYLDSSYNTETG